MCRLQTKYSCLSFDKSCGVIFSSVTFDSEESGIEEVSEERCKDGRDQGPENNK